MLESSLNDNLHSLREKHQADVYILSGVINDYAADTLIDQVRHRKADQANCVLILTTFGGDPDAGYRIVKCLKRHYKELVFYIYGYCKSTGTLMALGADKIYMSELGEFGPLDVQLAKDDEMHHTSGLSYIQSLVSINEQLFQAFEHNFLAIKERSSGNITTKTAAEFAINLSVGIMSPISAQIDPIKLGEVLRAVSIAERYGERLTDKQSLYQFLMHHYPSHGFVIDIDEAHQIFPNVIAMSESYEFEIEQILYQFVRYPSSDIMVGEAFNLFKLPSPASDDKQPSKKKSTKSTKALVTTKSDNHQSQKNGKH